MRLQVCMTQGQDDIYVQDACLRTHRYNNVVKCWKEASRTGPKHMMTDQSARGICCLSLSLHPQSRVSTLSWKRICFVYQVCVRIASRCRYVGRVIKNRVRRKGNEWQASLSHTFEQQPCVCVQIFRVKVRNASKPWISLRGCTRKHFLTTLLTF